MVKFSQRNLMNFDNFQMIVYETYTPRIGDVFFHGSPKDFESISPNEYKDGLVYLTRNLNHAAEYARGSQETFGGKFSGNGFVYAYKIDPSAKIINAKDDENLRGMFRKGFSSDYGYTEIIQQPEITNKILSQGWDGILQRQENLNFYNERTPKKIKRHLYNKRDGKEKWRTNIPMTYGGRYDGVDVLAIKPEFLKFIKKIPWGELDDSRDDYKKFK